MKTPSGKVSVTEVLPTITKNNPEVVLELSKSVLRYSEELSAVVAGVQRTVDDFVQPIA